LYTLVLDVMHPLPYTTLWTFDVVVHRLRGIYLLGL
jgi:hypothetical protein